VDLAWCFLIGLAAGSLTGYWLKGSGSGSLWDIVVGAVGALLGFVVFGPVYLWLGLGGLLEGRLIGSVIAGMLGAVALSFLLRSFRRPANENRVMAKPTMRLGGRSVLLGGLLTVLLAFPVAVLVALLFRFPIPFRGYVSGLEGVLPSLIAVVFYGCLGGFPLLAILGAVGGFLAYWFGKQDGKRTFLLTLAFALLVDVLATLTLAVLDKIIGPW
jgi:uncharacterized membrane protein YeaQ/YmgE (transglycosylase-associated protein family)